MKINFEYYKIFYYVCKYKNITLAANALLTSQPSISRAIANLEMELGCRLFIRSKKGVDLTPEGKLLYEHVSAGCEQIFKGESEIASSIGLKDGMIYLSATETALRCFLFRSLEQFNEQYPNVKFKILNNTTQLAIQALKNGTADIAVITTPFSIAKPLTEKPLKNFQDILIGGNKFKELKKRKIHLSELSNYPFVCLASGTTMRTFMDTVFRDNGLAMTSDIEPVTADLILPIVKHNLGLGFIPADLAAEEITAGNIFQITTVEPIPKRNISLVYDSKHPQSIAARTFQDFLMKQAFMD